MKRVMLVLLILSLVSPVFARGSGFIHKFTKLNIGMDKSDVQKVLGYPDKVEASLKGAILWHYVVNRALTPDEKGNIFVAGIFTAGLGWLGYLISEKEDYTFYFTADGKLIEWSTVNTF